MTTSANARVLRLPFGHFTGTVSGPAGTRRGLRLARGAGGLLGPEKYRMLDLRRRRAQIAARRALGL